MHCLDFSKHRSVPMTPCLVIGHLSGRAVLSGGWCRLAFTGDETPLDGDGHALSAFGIYGLVFFAGFFPALNLFSPSCTCACGQGGAEPMTAVNRCCLPGCSPR